jgi:hypothetical protein
MRLKRSFVYERFGLNGLKVIEQNKHIFKKVLDSLTDHSSSDPVVGEAVRNLTIGLNGINDILGSLLAEKLFPGPSPGPSPDPTPSGTGSSFFQFPQFGVNSQS